MGDSRYLGPYDWSEVIENSSLLVILDIISVRCGDDRLIQTLSHNLGIKVAEITLVGDLRLERCLDLLLLQSSHVEISEEGMGQDLVDVVVLTQPHASVFCEHLQKGKLGHKNLRDLPL